MSDVTIQDAGEKLTRAVKDDWAGRPKAPKVPRDPTLPKKPRRTRERAPLPVRPNLERLERTGPAYRDVPHVSPDDIIDMFGVRGVEFGNWVKPGERQACVDLAYDALWDLAAVLGVDPHRLNFGPPSRSFGIGFGSRGRGRRGPVAAAAHYEPDLVVINLTRMAGDGSLAHEMGHMLDHSLLDYATERDRKGRLCWVFPSDSWCYPEKRKALLPDPHVNAAFFDLMFTIMKADPKHVGAGWRRTSYYSQAQSLGGYWSKPREMFARVFECYVADWLAERGRVSQYLVHGVEGDRFATGFRGNPYPTGEERTRINAAMAKLIEAWRTTT